MENLTHSWNQNMPSSLPNKSYNVNNNARGFNYNSGKTTNTTATTTNDDVFGAPNYCEFLAGFNDSSIPVLDHPLVDDRDVYFDARNQSFDYREVFGGFNDLDLGPSFQELFLQQRSTGDSSDDAWTLESWSGGTEHSGCFSNGRDSYDTEFNINKASQISGGDTSETIKLKETGPSPGISRFAFEDKHYSSEPFVAVSDIGLKTHPNEIPPPPRQPLVLKSGFISSVSDSKTTGSEESVNSSPLPFFDVEVDARAAAEREAIIEAEEKPKSARELSERKKDGAWTTTKPTSTKNIMLEEEKLSHTTGLPNVDVTKKYLGDKQVSKSFSSQGPANSDRNDELKEPNQFVELVTTQLPRNADKNGGGKDVLIPLNAELPDQEQTWVANVDWEKQRRRAQGDRGDHEARTLSKHHGMRNVESTQKRHEDKLVEKAPEEKLRRVELHFEMGNNLLRSEENKGFTESHAKQKNELHCDDTNKRLQNQQLNRQPHQKAAEKKHKCVFEWEQNARNLREAFGNESTLEVSLEMNGNGKNLGMCNYCETKLNEALKRMEEETRIKEAHVREENERREREAFEKAENERLLKEALEQEEKMKKIKEALEKEENEWRAVEAREKAEEERKMKEQQELELRLIDAFKREEKNRRMKEAREKLEHERKMKVVRDQEERRIKEAHEKKENERRIKEALEKAELEQRLKEILEQAEKERQINEFQERKENERRAKEVLEQVEIERKLKEAFEQKEKERKGREAREKEENEKKRKEAMELEEKEKRLIEAFKREEKNRRMREALEKAEHERKMKVAREQEEERRIKEALEKKETGRRVKEALEKAELEKRLKETLEQKERQFKELQERQENERRAKEVLEQAETERMLKEAFEQKEKERKVKEAREKEENEKKLKKYMELKEKEKRLIEALEMAERRLKEDLKQEEMRMSLQEAEERERTRRANQKHQKNECAPKTSSGFRNHENKSTHQHGRKSINETQEGLNQDTKLERLIPSRVSMQREKEVERLKQERDFLMARLRKIEEEKEREREREREKDRMAFDQRALADTRERLEKACAEAREKSLPDKSSMEERLEAERAAVKRATTEARERAAEKAAFEAREQMERSVFNKQFQNPVSYGASKYQNSPGIDGESHQRYTSRLERHRRTADRVAKALAEKSMRDLMVQREQAERIRIAETLDADVKRWSNGKEGNIGALLSTLQYILGPESGWKPLTLTEVMTSASMKRAYRKATLCVHPDKLQQRGANIHQKYICEKVFDLLKEAWNNFNSEER